MRYIIISIITLVLPFSVIGQSIKIINYTTNEPVENAAIFNASKTTSTLTNEHGTASLSHFLENDTLIFQHTSYVRYSCTYKEAVRNATIKLTRKVIIMPEFVISASKHKETQRDIPHMVDVLSPQKLNLLSSQTSSDILTATGNVFVQKSQGGGGSPILRGFEANKILLVVDGVRMNNAIYRGGHLQNSVTLDPSILEKIEVVYGPNAIIYGSDALGGVIHYITRDPELANTDTSLITKANASVQIATANNSWKTHLDFNIGTQKFASLTSITNADYGNIRMGSRRDPYLKDYGKCLYYIDQINNVDSMVQNPDPLIQKNTNYKQLDFLQKFRYRPSAKVNIYANFQYSTSSLVPRYDMLNDTTDDGNLKYALWNYGPQNRILGSVKSSIHSGSIFFDQVSSIVAYQHIEESRIDRKYRKEEETHQLENVDVYSFNVDFLKNINTNHRLIYGLESNLNYVNSEAYKRSLSSREKSQTLARYPDDGSQTASYSAYAALKSKLGTKFILPIGVRYSYTRLQANYSDFITDIPFHSLQITNSSYTGSVGLIYLPSESGKVNLLLSTGYRIPNLDDIAKIRAKGDMVTFPNPSVKPEYTYNAELGFTKTFDGYIQFSATYFVSLLSNVIVRVPYTFENGSDTLFYAGEWLSAYVNDNSNQGIIQGFNLNMISDLNSNISFKGTLNYTYGHDLTLDQPLAHIPPIFGKADFIYEAKKFTHEFYFIYSGWKKLKDMALTGEDNEEEGTEYGFSGWYTVNLRTSYHINQSLLLQFALENMLDNFYKPFATAVAAPGINFIASLRIKI